MNRGLKALSGEMASLETTAKREGRKLVTACSTLQPLVGLRVRHKTASAATSVGERAGEAAEWLNSSFFSFLYRGSCDRPSAERIGAQRGRTASFIYLSIFSTSKTRLYLTNMSSLLTRLLQWGKGINKALVQWEAKEKGEWLQRANHLRGNRNELGVGGVNLKKITTFHSVPVPKYYSEEHRSSQAFFFNWKNDI